MLENLNLALLSIANDIKFQIELLVHNEFVIGFFLGLMVAIFISAFIITEDPRHLPIMLLYNKHKSFEKIMNKKSDSKNDCDHSFCQFARTYYRAKDIVYLSFIFFCLAIIVSVFFS